MRSRLGRINVAVFAVLVLLLWIYGPPVARARRTLPALLSGSPLPPTAVALESEAVTILRARGDAAEARQLLQRAIEVDPNGSALYVLADLLRMEGDLEGALELHERYRRVVPSHYPVYLSIAGIHELLGRPQEQRAALQLGRERMLELVDASVPRHDESASELANAKAEATHEFYREGLFRIRKELGKFEEPGSGGTP